MVIQLFSPILKEYGTSIWASGKTPEELGIINQKGLNRKVRNLVVCVASSPLLFTPSTSPSTFSTL